MSTKSDLFSIQTAQYQGANCIGMDTDLFFPTPHEEAHRVEMLRAICAGCIHMTLCRKDADENGDEGFRAGLTYKERRRELKRASGRRGKGSNSLVSVYELRLPRVKQLREQGLSNSDIARSMNLKVHAVDKVIRLIKDREAA